MKLIVGLGNPGKKYENTRHNVGFMFLDNYLSYKGITDSWISKFDGLYIETLINNEKVLFLKPQTFMNLSGNSVYKIMNYYKIDIEDVLIVSDDLDLSIGNFKLKNKGSCGGHNGIRNILEIISSNEIKRLKIGISNNKDIDTKDYVTSKFSKEEKNIINNLFNNLNHVLDDYFIYSFSDLMSKYNRKNK